MSFHIYISSYIHYVIAYIYIYIIKSYNPIIYAYHIMYTFIHLIYMYIYICIHITSCHTIYTYHRIISYIDIVYTCYIIITSCHIIYTYHWIISYIDIIYTCYIIYLFKKSVWVFGASSGHWDSLSLLFNVHVCSKFSCATFARGNLLLVGINIVWTDYTFIQLIHTESKHAQLHMHMHSTDNIFTSNMLHEITYVNTRGWWFGIIAVDHLLTLYSECYDSWAFCSGVVII